MKSKSIFKFFGFLLVSFWLSKTLLPCVTDSLNVVSALSHEENPVSILIKYQVFPDGKNRTDTDEARVGNRIKITRKINSLNDFEVLNSFSIDSNLKKRRSPLTAQLIDDFFEQKDSALKGIGQAVMNASHKYRINATYIMAHAILETSWGKSKIYRKNNNLFGWRAFDRTPWTSSKKFPSRQACIDYVMGRINVLYLSNNGKYFKKKPCLGNKTYGMNVYYASDPKWGQKIVSIAQDIEDWAVETRQQQENKRRYRERLYSSNKATSNAPPHLYLYHAQTHS